MTSTISSQSQPEPASKTQQKPHSSPLPHPKIKPLLKNSATWRCLFASDVTYINKNKPKMFSNLHISYIDPEQIKTNSIRRLCRALTDAKTVSSLVLHRNGWDHKARKQLEHVLNATNHWKKLEFYFAEYGNQSGNLSKESIENLLRLRRCRHLSSLNVYFDCNETCKNRILDHLSKQLRELPNLKTLDFDTSDCLGFEGGDDDPNASIFKFNYSRSLSSLSLNLQENTILDPELFTKFISNIERCHFLKDMNLNLSRICNKDFLFSGPAVNSPSLKTLTLYQFISQDQPFKGTQNFLEEFSHFKSLTTLNLELLLALPIDPSQPLPNPVQNHLTTLTNLKSLTLRLTNFVSTFVNPVISSLQYLPQLEALHLITRDCTINDAHLQALEQVLPHLKDLKNLELSLPSKDISPEGANFLANGLKQLSSLEVLAIDLNKADLSYRSTEILSKSIAHMNLKSFSLTLGKPYFRTFFQKIASLFDDEQRLTHLFSAVYGFNSLTNLSLNLSTFYVCYKEFMHFSLALKELQQLESLSLTLPQSESFRNFEGLRSFLAGLEALTKLTSLNLTFQGAGLCDKQVEFLASSLKTLKSLETLELHFKQAEKLSNETLKPLGLALKNLVSMRKLVISADDDNKFEVKAIVLFVEELTNIKSLESLYVFLKGIGFGPEFSDSTQTLRKIRNHQNFKHVKCLSINGIQYI